MNSDQIENSQIDASIVLNTTPDRRFVRIIGRSIIILVAVVVIASVSVFLSSMNTSMKVSMIPILIGVLFEAAILGLLYDELVRAEYKVTGEEILATSGVIERRARTIPLKYVRDVTYRQDFIKRVFGIADVTVSPTNGDAIVLKGIRDGQAKCEMISRLVLSKAEED